MTKKVFGSKFVCSNDSQSNDSQSAPNDHLALIIEIIEIKEGMEMMKLLMLLIALLMKK